jgi:lipoate-protein ligase B
MADCATPRSTLHVISRSILNVAELGVVEYEAALNLQQAMVAARIEDRIGDVLLLLEHPNVFTLGRGADEHFIIANPMQIPVHRISRGGQVTYHGPGQLIAYPILKLEGAARDVTRYLRDLEQSIVDALGLFDLAAERRENFTGVWIGPRKIASIGVGIRRWVTCHGFALNVATDLRHFDSIVPCGIDGCRMTSIAESTGREVTLSECNPIIAQSFQRTFAYGSTHVLSAKEIWRVIDSGETETQARS